MKVKIYPSVASGTVTAPPSKSILHRLLIMAALSDGKSIINNVKNPKEKKEVKKISKRAAKKQSEAAKAVESQEAKEEAAEPVTPAEEQPEVNA